MQTLPVIPLRGIVVLPGEVIHCDAGRKKTLAAMQAAASGDGVAFFCAQKDAQRAEITFDDLNLFGTICKIKQVFRIQGEGLHMLVTGLARAKVSEFTADAPYFEAAVEKPKDEAGDPFVVEAMRRRLIDRFNEFSRLNGKLTSDQRQEVLTLTDEGALTYAIARHTLAAQEQRQTLLAENDVLTRMTLLEEMLEMELGVLRVEQLLSHKVKERLERNQQEYVLREKIKVIHEELGDDGGEQQADGYTKRMREKNLPAHVQERLEKEIKRLRSLPMGSHERPVAEGYIECILELPWMEETKDNLDIAHARAVLDKDHYGMEKVKDRIIEYLAVQRLAGKPNGQILCLAGPPGVGKTSIAAAIAKATGRKFVRMSLGGVHDEAEIRGHRRTYIGAMPGRVIAAMKQAGSVNPVMLFDEIDKLGNDHRGDPTSAMLEVLDSAQNFAFQDHYLEMPYDLSKAMLLTTANNVDAIPGPLRNRMEIIDVPSYLAHEKCEIAKRHLLPRQLQHNGLKKSQLRITDGQIASIIDGYTREAGVRELERVLGSICRKAACEIVEGKKRVTLSGQKLTDYLGRVRYSHDEAEKTPVVGLVTGLAWTAVGGKTLRVEAAVAPGGGSIQLTGHLGDVMQESGRAAMTYVRAHSGQLGLAPDFYQKLDVHIHVPEGAVPKDGPSAGVTMATALLSALVGIPVNPAVAMTGEITLGGRVLPIGGLREKLLAAVRAGVRMVVLPEGNRKDLIEVPEHVCQALDIRFVEGLDEVFELALMRMPQPFSAPSGQAQYQGAQESVRC